jgi:ATP-dependent Lon protease
VPVRPLEGDLHHDREPAGADPAALRDRMEVIEVLGLHEVEKLADRPQRSSCRKAREAHGLEQRAN